MIPYQIKRGNTVFATIKAEGQVVQRIMGEHLVRFDNFVSSTYLDFKIGDTVQVYGITYTLRELPIIRKTSSKEFLYSNFEFKAPHYELEDVQFMTYDNGGVDMTLAEFPFTETANGFIDLLILNLNRLKTGWKKGKVIESDYLQLDFSGENCLEVLPKLAEAFDTEWHIVDKTIHLYRRGYDLETEPEFNSGLSFKYGFDNGLKDVERTNLDTKIITRLYPYGGERNLLGSYRNYSNRLLIPQPYGKYLSMNEDKYGVKEESVYFDDIYPYRIGQVTSINGIRKFTDQFIDFDVNQYLVPNVSVKVNFLTGKMAGFTMELLEYPNGFNPATKEFTFKLNTNDKAFVVPNETYKVEVGDLYVMSDIIMPPTYVETAESTLLEVAQFYLEQNSNPKINYNLTFDRIYFKRNHIVLELAKSIRLIDANFNENKLIRITYLERDINDPFNYTRATLSESVKLLSALIAKIKQRKIDKVIKDIVTPPRENVEATTAWRPMESSAYCLQGDETTPPPTTTNTVNSTAGASVGISLTDLTTNNTSSFSIAPNTTIQLTTVSGRNYKVVISPNSNANLEADINGTKKAAVTYRGITFDSVTAPLTIKIYQV